MTSSGETITLAYSRPFPGSEKVAVLLLALDRAVSSQLLHYFEPGEVEHIRKAADNLEPITQKDLDLLVEEFAGQFAGGMNFVGTPTEVHNLLNTALGEPEPGAEAEAETAEDTEAVTVPVWQRLLEVPEEQLLEFLTCEHPQLAAVVISKLDSERSSKIITQMPPDISADIMRRMVRMTELELEPMQLVENYIEEFLAENTDDGSSTQAHARIADMINRMSGEERQRVINSLSEVAPDDAQSIRRMLFSFNDIIKLSEMDCQILFGSVATDVLVTALSSVEKDLKEKILSALSARNRRMVEAELNGGNSPKEADVLEAQFKIASTALDLMREEKISIQDGEAE